MTTTSTEFRIIQAAKRELQGPELQQFLSLYTPKKKSVGVGVLTALFLGGLGVHHFYLGKTGLGVTYLLCSTVGWLLVLPPIVIAIGCIVDACLMGGTVEKYNQQVANELIDQLKLLAS